MKIKLLVSLSLFITNIAYAGLITGINGLMNINEEHEPHPAAPIYYNVNIIGEDLEIKWFAVSNSSNNPFVTYDANTTRSGWKGHRISAEQWDEGYYFQSYHDDIYTNTLGTFTSFFGNDLFVNVFTMTWETDVKLTAANAQDGQFYQTTGSSFSEFAAFSGSTVIDRSLEQVSQGPSTDVPEPSTLAIFALGLMGLASRRFKK